MEEQSDIQENSEDTIKDQSEQDVKPSEKVIGSEPIEYRIPKQKRQLNKKAITISVAAVLMIAGALIVSYFVFFNNGKSSNNAKVAGPNDSKKVLTPESDPQLAKYIKPTTGEVWLPNPVSIGKQGYYKSVDYGGETDAQYFKVGTHGDNQIIKVIIPGTVAYDVELFEKYPDGRVVYVHHPDANAVYNSDYDKYLSDMFSSKVVISDDIHYESLSIPDQIQLDDKGNIVQSPQYPSNGNEFSNPVSNNTTTINYIQVKTLGQSTLYRAESRNVETGLISIGYFIKTPINTMIYLRYEPLDLDLSKYQWDTGETYVGDNIHAISRGCSIMSASVTKSETIKDSDVVKVGKSGNQLTVYAFADANNTVLKKAYTEYKDYLAYDTTNSDKNITISDFNKKHAVVLFKDANNQWFIYVRNNMSPAYGCAKPVVYLYPQKEETVNVKVGANIKISEPLYDKMTGWNAVAKPNGQLMINGVSYNSLFWEGPGWGQYPEITEGTIVKQADLMPTIKKQLKQQGLNDNEINDFVDYWQNKLPTKAYVRLTWFNTAQMNELAPLFVYPKPDTVIRVFLDASGLDKPISIPAQHLKSIPRKGFTLVEWGGLPIHKL